MRTSLLLCVLGAGVIALTSTTLYAHGGVYRGPGDVVAPAPGPANPRPSGPGGRTGGPRTGNPGNPTAPSPTGPKTGGPTTGGPQPGPTGRAPGRPKTGGIELDTDLSTWNFWWEFNKHAYLGLRDSVHASGPQTGEVEFWMGSTRRAEVRNHLEPTSSQIRDEILPTLKRCIDSTEQRDIVSSCMIAMAKIGQDHPDFRLVDVFGQRLQRDNQEIRETAALALGIAAVAGNGAFDLLVDLALDSSAARQARGGAINVRTRSFALYAVGLFANAHADAAIKQRALTTMRHVLADPSSSNRNVKVAAIQGIGMLEIDRHEPTSCSMMEEALQSLLDYYRQDLGAGDQLIQAHCPTAITKLIGRDHARSDEFRQLFAGELDGRKRTHRRSADLARSCVLALGKLCPPCDDQNSIGASYSQLLADVFANHKDAQTRYFALLALGQIGGSKNRELLLHVLGSGNKALERPWAAIALGVQAHARYAAQARRDDPVQLDAIVGAALLDELRTAKEPGYVGALGVALGLCRHLDACDSMRELVRSTPEKEEQAGYLCIGLALMRDRQSIPAIRDALMAATRRVRVFVQAAIALGVLGDKDAADTLQQKFGDEHANLATLAAIAEALGQIGDRRSVAPLTKALLDQGRGDLQRAFAAVAIGAVADRARLPWHAEISTDINYRAAVETLTNQQSGVLDIL